MRFFRYVSSVLLFFASGLYAVKFSDVQIRFCNEYGKNEVITPDLLKKLQEGLVFAGLNLKVKNCENCDQVHINQSELLCIEKLVRETLVTYLQENKLDSLFSELDDPKVVKKCKKMLIKFINSLHEDRTVSDSDLKRFFSSIPGENIGKFMCRVCYKNRQNKFIDDVTLDEKAIRFVHDLTHQDCDQCLFFKFVHNSSYDSMKNIFDLISLYLNCDSLDKIDLSSLGLYVFPPLQLDNFPSLTLLNLERNQISDISLNNIKEIKKHKKLVVDLCENNISDSNSKRLERVLGNQIRLDSSFDATRKSIIFMCLFCPMGCITGGIIVCYCLMPFVLGCFLVLGFMPRIPN